MLGESPRPSPRSSSSRSSWVSWRPTRRPAQYEVTLYDSAPDRNEVLFAVGSGNTELWVRDLDTGVETQLLVTGGRNLNCGAFYYTENAVPEPGTLRLLGLGLIAVGFGIRSRRRNRR